MHRVAVAVADAVAVAEAVIAEEGEDAPLCVAEDVAVAVAVAEDVARGV
jgi:hypothetical protein